LGGVNLAVSSLPAVAFSAGGDSGSGLLKVNQKRESRASEKLAPLPCSLMTPKGNSRANVVSKRESNNEANCKADCNIARHNLAGAFSAGGDGGRSADSHP
jgi:hypothetical protein